MESARVDLWLWSVRLFKTRSAATAAARGGHVRINGKRVKPAAPVRVGDRVEARAGERQWDVEVVELLQKRVGAPIAVDSYIDHSPPPPPREAWTSLPQRAPGSGRPSKRDRRQMDRTRGTKGR